MKKKVMTSQRDGEYPHLNLNIDHYNSRPKIRFDAIGKYSAPGLNHALKRTRKVPKTEDKP